MTEQKCAAQHFGPWMVEPRWFAQAVAAVKSGTFHPKAAGAAPDDEDRPYAVDLRTGVAVIPIVGQMTKGESSFGGCSTVRVRQAVRKAAQDDAVSAILLHVDSPGGTVAGTGDLAADVADARKRKPVYSYIEDLGASAAYWVASQADRVFANPTAEIGSIGTMTYVEDTSKAYDMAGIKVTLIATGKYKGQWIDGNPVSEDYIQAVRTEIEDLNEHFLAGVAAGRGMTDTEVRDVADGRVHIAAKAKALGLIDEVASLDAAMRAITTKVKSMTAEQFSKYAAENPEAAEVKSIVAKGHKAGSADGYAKARADFGALKAALPGRLELAAEAFEKGQDVDTAKAIAAAADAEKARVSADIAAKDAEIERLKALVGTQGAIGTAGATQQAEKDSEPAPADPKAAAEAKWEKMSADEQGAWANKDVFVRFQVRSAAREQR
jgi:signal peptide peptidase SppA